MAPNIKAEMLDSAKVGASLENEVSIATLVRFYLILSNT